MRTEVRYGREIPALMALCDPEWLASDFQPGLGSTDSDVIEIDRLLMDSNGCTPELAAYYVADNFAATRQIEGLKYLARERENILMSVLTETVQAIVDRLAEEGRVSVHPRRMTRVLREAKKRGIEVEVLTEIRRVG